tara:strand:- start:607 stop:966 length:360 start_codon:yes stop_codon:yes gene_type:complete
MEKKDKTYKKDGKVYTEEGKRYISFKGTTDLGFCWDNYLNSVECKPQLYEKALKKGQIEINKENNVIWDYEIDCTDETYNKKGDVANWTNIRFDQTTQQIANKYCLFENWRKLPQKKKY